MKNKKIIIIIIIILIIGIIIGLYFGLKNTNKTTNINYEIVNEETNVNLTKKGYIYSKDNTYTISMGECNSGGYSLEIVSVKADNDNNITITVKEKTPEDYGNDASFITALTYPSITVKLSTQVKSIKIYNTKGYEYQQIDTIA